MASHGKLARLECVRSACLCACSGGFGDYPLVRVYARTQYTIYICIRICINSAWRPERKTSYIHAGERIALYTRAAAANELINLATNACRRGWRGAEGLWPRCFLEKQHARGSIYGARARARVRVCIPLNLGTNRIKFNLSVSVYPRPVSRVCDPLRTSPRALYTPHQPLEHHPRAHYTHPDGVSDPLRLSLCTHVNLFRKYSPPSS